MNMRSMKGKQDPLELFLNSMGFSFDAIIFTETWLTRNDQLPPLSGYKGTGMVREGKRGGGIAIYVKEQHSIIALNELSVMDTNVECMAVNTGNAIVVVVYRPPSGNVNHFLDFFENILAFLGNLYLPFFVMGDVNINTLSDESVAGRFQNLLLSYNCTNAITMPTRVTATSATSIDVCVTNINTADIMPGVIPHDISDHMPIFCLTTIKHAHNDNNKKRHVLRKINDESLQHFRELVTEMNWQDVFEQDDLNRAYNVFHYKLHLCYDAAFPLVTSSVRNKKIRKPWISAALYKDIKKKDRMYHTFIKHRDSSVLAEYKKIRNNLNARLKKAKKDYHIQKFSDIYNEPRKVWETVNSLSGRESMRRPVQEIKIGDIRITGQELVDTINEYFTTVGVCAELPNVTNFESTRYATASLSSIMFFPTTPSEVDGMIANLKNCAAAGFDEIKSLPIKNASLTLSPIISYLINQMFIKGTFPDKLKIARITPIHKGGDETVIQNYRPISVLPILSKIFERAIVNRLENFFAKHNTITKAQYGFQKNRSTDQALLHIKDTIIDNIENRLYTLGLFLDLRKAFDTVQHDILLRKLEYCGIRGVALQLLQSYLENRYQYVKIEEMSSNKLVIRYGVPQGSIMGPLLFLIYINDLVNIPGSPNVVMYADDTNVFFTGTNKQQLEEMTNRYLVNLSEWLTTNKLQLNESKTKYVIFRPINKRDNDALKIEFKNTTLEQVKEQKFLGVWFHEELTWNAHVSHIKTQLSRAIGCMYRIANLIPLWLKKCLYHSLFYSHLSYGILVWGTTTNGNYHQLSVLQNKVLRMYADYHGNIQDFHCEPHYEIHNMLKADQVYYFTLAKFIHKNKLYVEFSKTRDDKAYSFRHTKRPMPRIRTNYGMQKLNYQITGLLNTLEGECNYSDSFLKYKTNVKRVLISKNIAFKN